MKTFDRVWLFRGGAYTDWTATAFTGLSATIEDGDIVYFAADDWLAGILFLGVGGSAVTDFLPALYNGDEWVPIQGERALVNVAAGFTWDRAYSFQGAGALTWGKTREVPMPTMSSTTWPETATPPATVTRNWYRITFTTGGTTLDTVFPLMYNTYTTPREMAEFLGLADFDDIGQPNLNYIRRSIRDQEDWLDHYTRKSWRIRSTMDEGADFNPYGFRPRNQPVIMVTRLGLWNGSTYDILGYGRGEDFWLEPDKGMVFLTLPSFRMRYYSWLLSRYIRQPSSITLDYIWGADFETDDDAENVSGIVKRLVGADMVRTNDETGIFRSGLEILSKGEKLNSWREEAMERADTLRSIYMVGLGTGQW